MNRPLRVAIVGAGPAGMYAAGHLLEGPGGTYLDGRLQRLSDRAIEVDVYERLATPWGLLRHSVTADQSDSDTHTVFEHIAARKGFRYFGNIEVGKHVQPQELATWYDAVIYAFGASNDSRLNVPGEDLPGSLSARVFVAWCSGHPAYRDAPIDLTQQRVVIVGNGNVAMDVARILTQPIDALDATDIAAHALDALRSSSVREVVLLGRRAPIHAAFNNPELEELGELEGVDIIVEKADLPNLHDAIAEGADTATLRKIATLQRYSNLKPRGHDRRIVLRFLTSPIELLGKNQVSGLRVSCNQLKHDEDGKWHTAATGKEIVIECGLVLRAIGYFGTPLAGVPFDEERGIIPNADGRVIKEGKPLVGTYATGWIKRGPRGILGTNKKCSRDTVRALLADAEAGLLPGETTLDGLHIEQILRTRQPALIDQLGWLRIDDIERQSGREPSKPRAKLTEIDALLHAAGLSS